MKRVKNGLKFRQPNNFLMDGGQFLTGTAGNFPCCSAFCAAVFCLGLFLNLIVPPTAAAEGDCTIAETAFQVASKIRGLKDKKKVPCRLQNRKEVEKYLRSEISEKAPGERLKNEAVTFRLIGLIPWDYNYQEGLIQMYTDQLGGYYDSKKKYYAMADWMPAVMQLPIAVHELTHALQDQHFDLDKLIDEDRNSSDTMMARSALVEGDATAVMIDYTKLQTGQGQLKDDPSVSGIMMQNIAGTMMTASLQQAPGSLQMLLIFPYISGLNFAHALLRTDGGYQGIDRAYRRPPQTTAEILHPDRYLNNSVVLKDPPDPLKGLPPEAADYNEVYSDSFGEFVVSTWLSPGLMPVPASQVASGWAGDRLMLLRSPAAGKFICLWSTIWIDEPAAKRFFDGVEKMLTARFGAAPVRSGDTAIFTAAHPLKVTVTRSGDSVMMSFVE